MAKLGSQLKSQTQEVRETRTQRVRNVQAQQKAKRDYESEVARFENLKVQAKAIQEEQFKDQTVEFDQSYNIYRPKSYSAKSWNRLSAKRKANALKKYQKGRGIEYYARKGYVVVHSTATKKATKVFLGADALTKEGVINKIGSEVIARIAKQEKIPVYVIADSWKFTSKKIKLENRKLNEVWDKAPKGIKLKNPAFEFVKKKYITKVITENERR